MPTIRERFHTVANLHNKISIAAGCTKELLTEKPLTALTGDEIKAKQDELVQIFEKIENALMDADKDVTELKTFIYKKIDPETDF